MMLPVAEAQTECVSKLVPCYSFLNTTTKPSEDCCSSIKDAVEKDLSCLCTIYGANLSRRCGVPADLSACNASGAPSPKASLPPPGTPGKDTGAADKLASYGITTLILSLFSTAFF
ncbi:PREDICTED: LOW QUALITY PROTEIN: uncharacterized protein LOC104809448 [Tarenaya hassleriana]|uniref:LOW QUALITY PROTEIN: uncharacterized protein LOC104809448 n=1 Tax=Tarenaya hassleriana TaxID=28532 RepID=UPI00053C771D|nr:PREDICTED: LOW QUALITY PROTEIN: uncharacterized protein LOC104809448 [Tarenaya hassleriana]